MTKNAVWDIFENKLNKIEEPHKYLSFYDLSKVEGFSTALMKQDGKAFENILYNNGVNVSKKYNITKCIHRPLSSKQAYDGFRIDYTERTDKAWLNTGAASLEAHIYATGSPEMIEELLNLNPDNFDKAKVECYTVQTDMLLKAEFESDEH